MAKNIKSIAKGLQAEIVGTVPDVGGGAFGAARLAQVLTEKLTPGKGKRPGRPGNAAWGKRPKVPMSAETFTSLRRVAERLSKGQGRKISPMQVAAQILEEGVRSLQIDVKQAATATKLK